MAFPVTGMSPSTCSIVPARAERIARNWSRYWNAQFARGPRWHYTGTHPNTSALLTILYTFTW